MFFDLGDFTDTGSLGDPTVATAERGEVILNRMVDFVVTFLERFRRIQTRVPVDVFDASNAKSGPQESAVGGKGD